MEAEPPYFTGIHFTITAHADDQPRITALILKEYTGAGITFVSAAVKMPEVSEAFIPRGHPYDTSTKQFYGAFKNISTRTLTNRVNSRLLNIFHDRVMTLSEAKAEIREIVRRAAPGPFYPEEQRRIDDALSALLVQVRPYDMAHIRDLKTMLETFQSPQKSSRHTGGAEQVRVWLLSYLDKIGWHDTTKA